MLIEKDIHSKKEFFIVWELFLFVVLWVWVIYLEEGVLDTNLKYGEKLFELNMILYPKGCE